MLSFIPRFLKNRAIFAPFVQQNFKKLISFNSFNSSFSKQFSTVSTPEKQSEVETKDAVKPKEVVSEAGKTEKKPVKDAKIDDTLKKEKVKKKKGKRKARTDIVRKSHKAKKFINMPLTNYRVIDLNKQDIKEIKKKAKEEKTKQKEQEKLQKLEIKRENLIKEGVENVEEALAALNEKSQKTKKKKNLVSSPIEALRIIREENTSGVDDTIEIKLKINYKEKKGQAGIRGLFKLPSGDPKPPKILAFVTPEEVELAKKGGADRIAKEKDVRDILKGQIYFKRIISSTEGYSLVKTLARKLGPKGLMPNKKAGTLVSTAELEQTIRDFKTGLREFRLEKNKKKINLCIAKRSYEDKDILANIDAFIQGLWEQKPKDVKGDYIAYCYIRHSHGKLMKIKLKSINVYSPDYFYNEILQSQSQTQTPVQAKV